MDVFHDWCRSYLGRERTRRSRSGDVEHGRRGKEVLVVHQEEREHVEQPEQGEDFAVASTNLVECQRGEEETHSTTAQEGVGEYSTWTLRVEEQQQEEEDWSHRVKKSKRNLAVGVCHKSHTYSISLNKHVSEGSECTTRECGEVFVESDNRPGNRERPLVNTRRVQSTAGCCCTGTEEEPEDLCGTSLGCLVEDRMSSGPPSPFDVPIDSPVEASTGVNERIAAGKDTTTTAENNTSTTNGRVSTLKSRQQQSGVKHPEKVGGGPLYSKASTFPTSARQNHVATCILDELQRGVLDSSCPPHGAKSVMGRRAKMEDTFVAIPNLLQVAFADSMNEIIPPRIAEQIQELIQGGVPEQESAPSMSELRRACTMRHGESGKEVDRSLSLVQSTNGKLMEEKIHFFGVFDGHGGAAAAHHCKEIMHERLKEALTSTCFVLEESKSTAIACSSEAFSKALEQAFKVVDEEFASMSGDADELSLVGTTAVVTLLSSKSMYVANAGDSRAVLYRNGKAMALTDDHKAAREDETARVEAAGGQILFWNGVRVMGLLAVSRAIGDHSLRPYVIADPEVTVVNRQQGDELLVMASDGLWDVISNQEACALAKKCLLRARQKGSSRENAARVAATVLTRAAVDRGSRDNVTVLVIDLMQYPDDLLEADALKMRLSDEIGFAPEEKSSGEGASASGEEDSKVSADDAVPVPPTSITFDSPFDDSSTLDANDVDLGPRQSFKSPFEMMDGPRDSTQW